jgi:hypothetical protein
MRHAVVTRDSFNMVLSMADIRIIVGMDILTFIKYEINISAVILTDISNKQLIKFNQSITLGHHQYSSHNKTKEGQLDWTHTAQELPYKTHY